MRNEFMYALNRNFIISFILSLLLINSNHLQPLDRSVALDTPFESVEMPQEPALEHEEGIDQELLTSLYSDRIGEIDQLMFYAQSLIGCLEMHLIKCDEKAAHAWLQNFIELCSQAKLMDTVISLPLCFTLAEQIRFLAETLDNALSTNLYFLPLLTALPTTIEIDDTTSPEKLLERMQEGSARVQNLYYKIDKIGSKWYQRTYNGLRAINSRYQVWGWTKTLAGLSVGIGLSAGSVAALLYLAADTFPKQVPNKFREFKNKMNSWLFEDYQNKFGEASKDDKNKIIRLANAAEIPTFPEFEYNEKDNTVTQKLGVVKFGKVFRFKKAIESIESLSLVILAEDHLYQFNQRHKLTDWVFKAGDKIHSFLSGVKPEVKDGTQYIHNITLDNACFDFIRKDLEPVYNVLEYLENPEKFIRTNRKITKSLLFVGPPGSGKTEAGLALIGSINAQNKLLGQPVRFRIKVIDPHDLVVWSPEALKYFIEDARQMAPCVIWLDEIHTAGLQVNNNGTFALAQLLKELDSLNKNNDPQHQIYFVAATNRPDLLSGDLMRPGRFETIHFSIPAFEERKHILQLYTAKKGYRIDTIDFDLIARITEGVSRSMLHEIFKKADFKASALNQQLTTEHLYQIVNEIVRRQKNEYYLTPHEENTIAIYQAGGALAHVVLDLPQKLESVTIKAISRIIVEQSAWDMRLSPEEKQQAVREQHKPEYGRIYTWSLYEQVNAETTDVLKKRCKVLLAGSVAQEIVLGARSTYRDKDRQEAFALAQTIVLEGLVLESLSDEQKRVIKDKALIVFKECEQEVRTLLMQRQETLTQLIALLCEHKTVRINEIQAIL
jgi:AAA+ superfamily predicted ATPase